MTNLSSPSLVVPALLEEDNDELPFNQVTHLLYGLHYMATNSTFDAISAITGKDEKTVRKWTWIVIKFLAEQDWVSQSTELLCTVTLVYISVQGTSRYFALHN